MRLRFHPALPSFFQPHPRLRRCVVVLMWIAAITPLPPLSASEKSAVAIATSFDWERWPDMPDPVGLKGTYTGLNAGHLILAGGSNFPVPRNDGGSKELSRKIWTRAASTDVDAPWLLVSQQLPTGRAEGAVVTTEHGVVGIGGLSPAGALAEVVLFNYQPNTGEVTLRALPELPEPWANAAAVYTEGILYVAGGENGDRASDQLWSLDLAAAERNPAGTTWTRLPSWPGPARFGAMITTLSVAGRPQLVLVGGRVKTGQPVQAADYLSTALTFDLQSRTWAKLPDMPHPSLLGAVLPLDTYRMAVLGGSDGHNLVRMAEMGARYRIPDRVMIYDSRVGQWALADPMPLGVVGAPIVPLSADNWLVVGGEYSPSLRTPRIYRVNVTAKSTGGLR